MREKLVSFKVAKLAKEKGLNEKSQYYYVFDFGSFQRTTTPLKFKTPLENENIYQSCKLAGSQPHLALAPTQSLLQKWLREIHVLHIDLRQNFQSKGKYFIIIYETSNKYHTKFKSDNYYNTYEEALEEGLYQTLNLIK